jgi:hypothetical protein
VRGGVHIALHPSEIRYIPYSLFKDRLIYAP